MLYDRSAKPLNKDLLVNDFIYLQNYNEKTSNTFKSELTIFLDYIVKVKKFSQNKVKEVITINIFSKDKLVLIKSETLLDDYFKDLTAINGIIEANFFNLSDDSHNPSFVKAFVLV